MRTLGAPLAARFARGSDTICDVWTITRRDGTVLRFTNLDKDLSDGVNTYQATNSFNISAISASIGKGATAADMSVVLSNDAGFISRQDVEIGLFNDAFIEIDMLDWEQPTLGKVRLMTGYITGALTTNRQQARFNLLGLLQKGLQRIGESYGPECRVDLGSAKCGVNLGDFTTTGVVDTVNSRRRFSADLADNQVDNYYQMGVLTWTSGDNDGTSMEVLLQQAADATLDDILIALNAPRAIQAGDEFSIVAGCDKRPVTCKEKFSNKVNFRGEDFAPGNEAASDISTGPGS